MCVVNWVVIRVFILLIVLVSDDGFFNIDCGEIVMNCNNKIV